MAVKPCDCGNVCPWEGLNEAEPCWGVVEVYDQTYEGDWMHACEGHFDLAAYGSAYVKEPAHG